MAHFLNDPFSRAALSSVDDNTADRFLPKMERPSRRDNGSETFSGPLSPSFFTLDYSGRQRKCGIIGQSGSIECAGRTDFSVLAAR